MMSAWKIDSAFAAAALAVVASAGLLIVAPALARADEARARRQEIIASKRTLAEGEREFEASRAQLDERLTLLRREQIPLARASTLNARIAALAGLGAREDAQGRVPEHAVWIDQIGPGNARGRGELPRGLSVVPLRLQGRGSYAALTELLAHLRGEFPDMNVSALRVSASSTSAGPAAGQFSLELDWIVVDDGAAEQAVGADRAVSTDGDGAAGVSRVAN
ncbi:MAG: hypothetical protein SFY95_02635 [Planctomycetota bacterium]|nr:hypothetical protein [Planctomycetota bacterium]